MNDNLPRERSWEYIVIHHTASEWSSLKRIDAFHRRKFNDPDGIEYHFLIGNGKKAPAGLIEIGRWKLQKRAIHLFKPDGAPRAIAVSLVGNFHEREMGDAQYQALLELVVQLVRDQNISVENITTHTRVDGRLTVCPGKHFPYDRLIADVKKRTRSGTVQSVPRNSNSVEIDARWRVLRLVSWYLPWWYPDNRLGPTRPVSTQDD